MINELLTSKTRLYSNNKNDDDFCYRKESLNPPINSLKVTSKQFPHSPSKIIDFKDFKGQQKSSKSTKIHSKRPSSQIAF